jgi:hypothetical protein
MDINVNLNIPAEDLERLIGKATTSVITIICVATTASIVHSIFRQP